MYLSIVGSINNSSRGGAQRALGELGAHRCERAPAAPPPRGGGVHAWELTATSVAPPAAGTLVVPNIWSLHRRPSLYPEPERFDPDRFAGRRFAPWEWFPFGGGARRCVGMHFALWEMKMVLAAVLRRADLSLVPGHPVRLVRRSSTFSPSEGLPVVLDRRWMESRFVA